jgi:hypothetical protein
MSEDAHFHPWELGFKQSGLRHITRALRSSTINAFTMLRASRHAVLPSRFPVQVRQAAQRRPPSEPLLSVRVIQRRVRRRNFALRFGSPGLQIGRTLPRRLHTGTPSP